MRTRALFIFYALLIVGIIMVGFGVVTIKSKDHDQKTIMMDRKKQLILEMSNICERAFFENELIFEGFLQNLKQEIGFVSAQCLDMDGNELVWGTKRPQNLIPTTASQIDPNLIYEEVIDRGTESQSDKVYEIVAPLLLGGQQAGFAKLVFSQNQIESYRALLRWQMVKQLIYLSLLPFILAILGALGFAKALQRLKDLDEKKQELISSVTHEFRSPITAIQSFVELMIKGVYGPPTPKQREVLHVVRNNTVRLSRFVDDLLVMAKFEGKSEDIFIEEIDVDDLFSELMGSYQPLAQEKSLTLQLSKQHQPCVLNSDRQKVFQILENLISNAIKYTDRGGVELEAEHKGGQIILRVRDTGHGMSDSEVKQIFDPFFRSEKHRQTVKGTGLGLSIVNMYVQSCGATVQVESRVGKGSCFSVIFEEKEHD